MARGNLIPSQNWMDRTSASLEKLSAELQKKPEPRRLGLAEKLKAQGFGRKKAAQTICLTERGYEGESECLADPGEVRVPQPKAGKVRATEFKAGHIETSAEAKARRKDKAEKKREAKAERKKQRATAKSAKAERKAASKAPRAERPAKKEKAPRPAPTVAKAKVEKGDDKIVLAIRNTSTGAVRHLSLAKAIQTAGVPALHAAAVRGLEVGQSLTFGGEEVKREGGAAPKKPCAPCGDGKKKAKKEKKPVQEAAPPPPKAEKPAKPPKAEKPAKPPKAEKPAKPPKAAPAEAPAGQLSQEEMDRRAGAALKEALGL